MSGSIPEGFILRSVDVLRQHPEVSTRHGLSPDVLHEVATHARQYGPVMFEFMQASVARKCAAVFALARYFDPDHLASDVNALFEARDAIGLGIHIGKTSPGRCESLRRVVEDDSTAKLRGVSTDFLTYDSVYRYLTTKCYETERTNRYRLVTQVLVDNNLDESIARALIDAFLCESNTNVKNIVSRVFVESLPKYQNAASLVPTLVDGESSFLATLLHLLEIRTFGPRPPHLLWWQQVIATTPVPQLAQTAEYNYGNFQDLVRLARTTKNPTAIKALENLDPSYYIAEFSSSRGNLSRSANALHQLAQFKNRWALAFLENMDVEKLVYETFQWNSQDRDIFETMNFLFTNYTNLSVIKVLIRMLQITDDERAVFEIVWKFTDAVNLNNTYSQELFSALVEAARNSSLVLKQVRSIAEEYINQVARQVLHEVESYKALESKFPGLKGQPDIPVDEAINSASDSGHYPAA